MDRFWLLTWTTYGTRLPGDTRGFVGPVREGSGREVRHNVPGTPFDHSMPGLERAARDRMTGDPIRLSDEQAVVVITDLRHTAQVRGWDLFAAAAMADHVHLVVGVPLDPDPATLLRDFKSYGSRALNKTWGKPASGTWWTESGSRRVLRTEESVIAAVEYVWQQHACLERSRAPWP